MWHFDPLTWRIQQYCELEMRGMEEREYIPLLAEEMQVDENLMADILKAPYWDSSVACSAMTVLGVEVPAYEDDKPYRYSCEEEAREAAACLDCHVDTQQIGEYYMLTNQVWYSVTKRTCGRGMLCLGCVENRLGRTLMPDDFRTGVPINEGYFPRSERFVDRMGR